jgi:hypothetical protein
LPESAADSGLGEAIRRSDDGTSGSHHAGFEKVYIPMSASALTTIIAVTQESIESPAIPSSAIPGPTQRAIRYKPAFELMIPLPQSIDFLKSLWQITLSTQGDFDLDAHWSFSGHNR